MTRRAALAGGALILRLNPRLRRGDLTLEELALRYGTDKSSDAHGFAAIYDSLLRGRRHEGLTLLEIGVLGGASAQMWRHYFPNARLAFADIDPDTASALPPGCAFRRVDQADAAQVEALGNELGPFDVVIEDGGHTYEQQLTSLRVLWPHVRPGGLYAVEDLFTSYTDEFETGPGPSTASELKQVVDDLNAGWHGRAQMLEDVAEMHAYPELIVFVKARRAGFAARERRALKRRALRTTAEGR